jgi:hypothetical protein
LPVLLLLLIINTFHIKTKVSAKLLSYSENQQHCNNFVLLCSLLSLLSWGLSGERSE